MEDKAITSYRTSMKPNGNMKTEKLYSYAVLLTAPGPEHVVHAVRMDGYLNKFDVLKDLPKVVSGPYKVKNILKLYESDFQEDKA